MVVLWSGGQLCGAETWDLWGYVLRGLLALDGCGGDRRMVVFLLSGSSLEEGGEMRKRFSGAIWIQ